MRQALIIDNDLAAQSVLNELLRLLGYDVLVASDGPTAMELARSQHLDLILIELALPGFDKMVAIRTLAEATDSKAVHIIAMSADADLRRQAADLPVAGVIAKPFDLDSIWPM